MKKLLFVLSALMVLVSACNKREKFDIGGESLENGKISLNLSQEGIFVDAGTKSDTKSEDKVDVKDFRVRIWNGTTLYKEFEKYSDVPNILEMAPGQYRIEAGTVGDKEAAFNQPIYLGESTFNVEAGKVAQVKVMCTLSNMKVTIKCTQNFLNEFNDDFKIVVKNENDGFLVFDKNVIAANTSGYFKVSKLTVVVNGTRKLDNSEITHTVELSSVAAKDHHILTFDAQEVGEMSFGNDWISIDYSVNDREMDVTIPGEDENPVDDGNQGGNEGGDEGGNQGGDTTNEYLPTITGNGINSKLVFTDAEAENAVIDITVSALNNKTIQGLTVQIESAFLNEEFMKDTDFGGTSFSLTDFGEDEASQKRKKALEDLGLIDSNDPVKGKTTYTFSIGAFVPMLFLGAEPGADNIFTIIVVDSEGKQSEAFVNIVKSNS